MKALDGDNKQMRVGIVGCGRVAEHHLKHIRRTRCGQVVGLADTCTENLRRLGIMYSVSNLHSSLEGLLDSTPVDVIHICTPPSDHFSMARSAIRGGAHVLVEKPLASSAAEVAELYAEANTRRRLVCPDFLQLFHPAMLRVIKLVKSGVLGKVVHCVCNYGFAGDDPALREAVGLHWVYRLPGGPLQNHLSHPLYLVLWWLGTPLRTLVLPKAFGTLPRGMPDHLEITLEGQHSTGHITLTMVDRPSDYYLTLHCERGIVTVNFRTMTVVIERHGVLPGSVERLTSAIRQAGQLSKQFVTNTVAMARGALIPYQGLGNLIRQFYDDIATHSGPPVPQELAIAVSKTEDAVLAQIGRTELRGVRPAAERREVVVTGATGFLGREVVRRLVKSGHAVRALVRPQSPTDELEQLGVELAYGDVRDRDSLRAAFEGASIVIHLAAGLRGSERFMLDTGVNGTANVAAAARESGIRRVIYTSSVAVYDLTTVPEGGMVTEDTPLESRPERRGTYSMVKCLAERTALRERSSPQTPWTILRPAVVFGNGHSGVSLVGFTLGSFLVSWGRRNRQLRLIHVADVAAAIVTMCEDPSTAGRVFNLAHPDPITAHQYIRACLRARGYGRLRVIYFPYWLFAGAAVGLRLLSRIVKRAPKISAARVIYSCRGVRISSARILTETKWKPSDSLLAQVIAADGGQRAHRLPWEIGTPHATAVRGAQPS